MATVVLLLAILITVAAGVLIVKRYQTHMVLLFAALALLALALLTDHNILPKGTKPSGLGLFDLFALFKAISAKQAAETGLIIMSAGGFAKYMDHIGAASALVRITVKPLKSFHSPYVVLVLGYFLAQALCIIIPSAAGLAMLLLVCLLPVLVNVGVSTAAAAAVIGTSAGLNIGPVSGMAILAAKVAGLEPIVYFVKYQLPVAIPTLLAMGVTHYLVQRHFDKKNDDEYSVPTSEAKEGNTEAPYWYGFFPILPLVLLIIFSKLVYKSIILDTIASLYMVWALTVLIELVRRRDPKKAFSDAMVMFKAMGSMFGTIVSLIICAELFATGLTASGLIGALIDLGKNTGMGLPPMTVLLTGIVGIVTLLTGSGVGAYSSFASLAPDVVMGLGGSVESLVTPMQFASGLFRAMSPVAGCIIAVAGVAGLSPFAVVRRTALPACVGAIVTLIANYILFQ